jgi:hypothetical protein
MSGYWSVLVMSPLAYGSLRGIRLDDVAARLRLATRDDGASELVARFSESVLERAQR